MKRQNFLIFCMILFSGCTSSPMVLRQADLSHDVKAQESEVNKDGISLKVKCIHLKSEMKTYFDRDLLYYGILPVQIYLQNKSYPGTVILNTDGINLIDLNGAKNPMMSCDQIIEKRKETPHYMLGTTTAVWSPLGFIGLSIDRLDKKKKIQYSFKLHSIKFRNLILGAVAEGFAFFSVPQDLSNLNWWKISVILKDTDTNKDIILDYALSGNIVPPKERSIWQEDRIDPF
jgi:hypothetical protein